MMASIRSRGNASTELAFLRALRAARISGWRRHMALPGSPDFAFPKRRIAVFLDGCFWHGCDRHFRLPVANRPYWLNKVERNRCRDRRTTRALRAAGWRVLRVWEHSLGNSSCLHQVLKLIETCSVGGRLE